MIISLFVGLTIGISILIFFILLISFICYRIVFFSNRKKQKSEEKYPVPPGEIYEIHREKLAKYIDDAELFPSKKIEIKTFDGLTLRGTYYEYSKDAPIELMFHGYRGNAKRDLTGGVIRCFNIKRSVLIVDHRGSGKSDGKVITFGVKERKDCLMWINYILNNINKDAKIILTGISMGAATVMLATNENLPKNVIGVIADCGYTSGKNIIKKVIKDIKLPPSLFYPFVRLGGIIYGHFDINKATPNKALENCELPIIFFHGDTDSFIPHKMSEENYAICKSEKKKIVTIHNAGHGLCYVIDSKKYEEELINFFDYI